MESKAYLWKWLTADELLSHGPCELYFAMLTAAAAAATATLYDGENTTGRVIVVLEATTNISQQIHLNKGVYCEHGLYVDVDANATGILVQWRELVRGKGGPPSGPP